MRVGQTCIYVDYLLICQLPVFKFLAEISTSCLLISAQVQFVSDSFPAQPQVSIRRFTRTSKGPVIQQSVSLPDHSQRSTLAEFHVPPNLTPQVLIEDNFSELVEIVEEVNQPILALSFVLYNAYSA